MKILPKRVNVLVGPAGSGKTFAMKHYARETRIDPFILPWSNFSQAAFGKFLSGRISGGLLCIDEYNLNDSSGNRRLEKLSAEKGVTVIACAQAEPGERGIIPRSFNIIRLERKEAGHA